MSERHFRRLRDRYEAEGAAGLVDRRLGRASGRRAPLDQIEWVLEQYRTRYWDLHGPSTVAERDAGSCVRSMYSQRASSRTQRLVERGDDLGVEAVEALDHGEARGLDEEARPCGARGRSARARRVSTGRGRDRRLPRRTAGRCSSYSRRTARQLHRLELVGEQHLRCVGHAPSLDSRLMYDLADVIATTATRQIRIDVEVEPGRLPLDAAQYQVLHLHQSRLRRAAGLRRPHPRPPRAGRSPVDGAPGRTRACLPCHTSFEEPRQSD